MLNINKGKIFPYLSSLKKGDDFCFHYSSDKSKLSSFICRKEKQDSLLFIQTSSTTKQSLELKLFCACTCQIR
jgi:hypothetical protein